MIDVVRAYPWMVLTGYPINDILWDVHVYSRMSSGMDIEDFSKLT